jgi:hypothetical protein
MSVSGICEVCETPDVDHSCTRCAQLVCSEHYDEELGLCVECVAEVGGGDPGRRRLPPEDAPDGVDTYEF